MTRRCRKKCPGDWRGRCCLEDGVKHELCICEFPDCSCHEQSRYLEAKEEHAETEEQ